MSNDGKFWISIWIVGGLCLVAIALVFSFHYRHNNKLVAEMVKNGASPIEAACSFDDSLGNNPSCIIFATKQ